MRSQIRTLVAEIDPFDGLEREHLTDTLEWIDSGVELCRTAKPAVPPKHFASYAVVIDSGSMLLVDYKASGLWLPPGGHVEPGEHPMQAAQRELNEELGLTSPLMRPTPYFLTTTCTRGAGSHTDVSL